MPSKQQEFYDQLKQNTEANVLRYNEFQKQIDSIKETAAQRIRSLKEDMKWIAKEIAAANKKLKAQGIDEIKFEK